MFMSNPTRGHWRSVLVGALTAFAALTPFGVASAQPDPRPPNIILILADDLGSMDLGCYGAPDVRTPHLDALAARGLRLTQFYSAAPVCSPSRAALLTGRFPHRAGVPGNVPTHKPGVGLAPAQVTLAEALRPRGYATALFGKWHLGWPPINGPLEQGFDEYVGHLSGCIDNYSHFFYWAGPPFHDLWRGAAGRTEEIHEDGTHFGEIVTREAIRFITARRDAPFFLYLPFNIPHYPVQAPEPFRSEYAHLPEPRGAHAALIAAMDAWVGRVLNEVDKLGLRENTIVVFLSDHGHSTEERTGFGGGYAGPYRGEKFSLFEGGLRVPCIVSWPGRLPEGETRDQAMTSLDLFPTLLELARGETTREKIQNNLDGVSVVNVLTSASAPEPHDFLYWRAEGQWAVHKGRMKLIANPRGEPRPGGADGAPPGELLYLVDLENDPGERVNIAAERPEIVEDLSAARKRFDP